MLDQFETPELPRKRMDIDDLRMSVYSPAWGQMPEKRLPVVTIGTHHARIASEGNISLVVAQPGAGKSAVCEALCANALNPQCDAFGLNVQLNFERKILYIDSERDVSDHYDSWMRMMSRAGITTLEDDLLPSGEQFSTSIVDFQLWTTLPSATARMDLLFDAIESERYALVIADGFGDFVKDVNDPEEVDTFASGLRSRIIDHRVAVFGTIHANPNDEKARGHLGSELMRRAESVFILQRTEDNRDVRELTTDYKHGKVRNAVDNLRTRFEWDFAHGMFRSTSQEYRPSDDIVERDRLSAIAWQSMGDAHLNYDEILVRMTTSLRITRRQAEQEIVKLMRSKLVVRNQITRKYHFDRSATEQ